MIQRDAPSLGQEQLPPAPREQRMPQPIFKLPDLRRQRRLRQVQPLGRAGQMPLARDFAEIAQMVVIEPIHDALK